MTKVEQTNNELMMHLRDNIGFLEASNASFDAGILGEAKRLATTIRVLVHDTKKSKSLLGLLDFKTKIKYLSTAYPVNPHNLLSHHGLIGMVFGGTTGSASYCAPLGDLPPGFTRENLSFLDWWEEVVIIDSRKAEFTRKDLILALANKDGGAHVDTHLDIDYAELTRNNSVGWEVSSSTSDTEPLLDVELFSARQIAYELLIAVNNYLAGSAPIR